MLWSDDAARLDILARVAGCEPRAPARHRHARPRHPLPRPRRDAAVGHARRSGGRSRRVDRHPARRAARARRRPRRPAGHRVHQPDRRVPGAARRDLRRRRSSASARRGAVVGIGVAVAPYFARLSQTLVGVGRRLRLPRCRAHARRRARPAAAPAHPPERRRAAADHDHDRGGRRAARARRASASSGSACSRRSTTGAGC